MLVYSISSYPSRGCGVSKYSNSLTGALEESGVEVIPGRIFFQREKLASTAAWLDVIKQIRKTRPDAIHLQYTPTICGPLLPLFLALARAFSPGSRVFVTAHEKPSVYARHLGRWSRPVFHLYERLSCSLADMVLVHTREHREELISFSKVRPRKIKVIDHGVDKAAEVFPEQAREFREGYGLGNGAVISFLGIIRPNKGLEHLISAMPCVIESNNDLTLVVAGDAPPAQLRYLEDLKRMAADLGIKGHIVFTGYIEDGKLPAFLTASDMLVLPYTGITQSGVLFREAIAYEKPVIVTDVGGIGETVSNYGIGLVVPPSDSRALAEAIAEVLGDDEKRSFFIHNERSLKGRLDWKNIALVHISLYAEAKA